MKMFRVLLLGLSLGMPLPAMSVDFTVHGDLNHRFSFTNQSGLVSGAGEQSTDEARLIKKGGVNGNWANIKYRLWGDASTNDGKIRGVYAVELGGLHFGKQASDSNKTQGANYSGDGVNIETRWAYVDLQLPFIENQSRVQIGLAPVKINPYLWNETAMGVQWYGVFNEKFDYRLGWIRGFERQNNQTTTGQSVDSFFAKGDFKPFRNLKVGSFVAYTNSHGSDTNGTITDSGYEMKSIAKKNVDLNVWMVGVDGNWKNDLGSGQLFVNWDGIYEGGKIKDAVFETNLGKTSTQDMDVSGYFLHNDIGFAWDSFKTTYTFWYASGDGDSTDNSFDGFFSVDVDTFNGSTILMESYDDDNYFTERPYLLDKGMIMNKVSLDWTPNSKLSVGTAAMYMMTASDIKYNDADGNLRKSDKIGKEITCYASYKLYPNTSFSINAAYLLTDSAMDYWDVNRDGKADENIFRTMARLRYKF
jgi:hypothetical protein